MLEDALSQKLEKRKQESLLRSLITTSGLTDFYSNDYLGLARSEELYQQIQNTVQNLPHQNGATGSRLLSGNNAYTESVEQQLATVFAGERALIFNSGYTANLAVLSALPQRGDSILYDERAHTCMKDGARLSLAQHFSFRHNDLNDLEQKLKKASGQIFLAVESIYSMDGDECPLTDLVTLAEKYNANIVLDEAHSTGAYGKNGSGLACAVSLQHKIPVRIYTFGKAMGIHGACIVGSEKIIQYLINFARPFIYTTALPPHSIASIACAFKFLSNTISLQNTLQSRINTFLVNSKSIAQRIESKSAIQTVLFPGNENARSAAHYLQQNRLDVRAILSPTVPEGSERLRVCLHTYNTDEEILTLCKAIKYLTTEKKQHLEHLD
ncbi:MAG: 8-amino-7-oxononanoate synthase [Cyclobacteriaceae bacterium]|nr:8-amino-7-oxononanoate synthase [Cyclobacteriaceae bacterium]